MKIGLFITARLKSTRLPLKLLRQVGQRSLIEVVLDRARRVREIDSIVLCTSSNPQDRALTQIAIEKKIPYYLGSEEDVLNRLLNAAEFFGIDFIVSITGENPFFSLDHTQVLIDRAKNNKPDFILLEGLPIGCAVYGINVPALKAVCEYKKEIDTEIWGPLLNQPDFFRVEKIEVEKDFYWPELRLTVDYFEDLELINKIFSELDFDPNIEYDLLSILKLLRKNHALIEINKDRKQKSIDPVQLKRINEFYKENSELIKSKISKYKY